MKAVILFCVRALRLECVFRVFTSSRVVKINENLLKECRFPQKQVVNIYNLLSTTLEKFTCFSRNVPVELKI